jgi:hypothetical protein
MHKSILFIAVAVMAVLVMQPPAAGAQDTSPYLAGTWGSAIFGQTPFGPPINYFIGNPSTKALDVYAAFYTYDGVFTECVTTTLQPNGSWYLFDEGIRGKYSYLPGTVKFFAFPAGTRKLDPNAIIGGFQQELLPNIFVIGPPPYTYGCQVLEVNLKAVTINSSTTGEFTKVPWAQCNQWQNPAPPGYPPGIFCNGLIEPTPG